MVPVPERPLRVAQMLESDGPGGAETVLIRLSAALRARGHVVVPIGPVGRAGWLGARLREIGFEPDGYVIRRPLDWQCLRDLVRLLRARRVDVVHSHEFTMAVYGAAAAWRLGVPHVVTMHGSQYVTAKWRRRAALRWAFRRSTAVVGVSADTTAHLARELRVPAGLIRTIPNGVPYQPGDRGAARRALGVNDSEVLVLAVGSLIVRKGHGLLIRALARVGASTGVPWRLAIAGQGQERESLLALAAERGVSDRVHLLGQRADIADLHAAADIFAMPSLWEGLPLALLEAMFAGRAIVASAASGIPEAVTDGVEGLLTPPGDEAALGEALRRLMIDPQLRAALGTAARARAEAQFSMERMTDDYEALYVRPDARDRAAGPPAAA